MQPGWKITDFGLTSEGSSRIAYTTHHSRGTESYRAPELLKDGSVVSMKSDVFALGCILYELVTTQKAFPRDFHAFEYTRDRRMPEIIVPDAVDNRGVSYFTQLIRAVLQVDWWKRPPARDILRLLSRFADGQDEIWSESRTGQPTRIDSPSHCLLYTSPSPRDCS